MFRLISTIRLFSSVDEVDLSEILHNRAEGVWDDSLLFALYNLTDLVGRQLQVVVQHVVFQCPAIRGEQSPEQFRKLEVALENSRLWVNQEQSGLLLTLPYLVTVRF